MTSTVSAELRPEVGFHDIFRALFPCGSVTGAPKVRAMQLLAELEDAPRGVYTGAIGFFSPQQTVFNVAIRTLELGEVATERGNMGAGSGIVIDSDAADEYPRVPAESGVPHRSRASHDGAVNPAARQAVSHRNDALGRRVPFASSKLHLDRLADSADYFGFACDRAAIRAALEQHARQFAEDAPRKVRLLMIDADGNVQISSEPLQPNRRSESRRPSMHLAAPHRSRRPHALPQDHPAAALRARISRSHSATVSTMCSS